MCRGKSHTRERKGAGQNIEKAVIGAQTSVAGGTMDYLEAGLFRLLCDSFTHETPTEPPGVQQQLGLPLRSHERLSENKLI